MEIDRMAAKPKADEPKWRKVTALHEAGKIDLRKLSERGYSSTIVEEYGKAHKGETVVYQDWTKAAQELGIAPTKSPKATSRPKGNDVSFATVVALKTKLSELGGRDKVNKMINDVGYLADLVGGHDKLTAALALIEQYEAV